MYDKIRIGQQILTGHTILRERVVFRINSLNSAGELSYSCLEGSKILDFKSRDIFSIVSGPTEPETIDEDQHITVPFQGDSAICPIYRIGEEISFKTEYMGAELEVRGFILVSGKSWSLCSERGVSVPNRAWRVHNSILVPTLVLEVIP